MEAVRTCKVGIISHQSAQNTNWYNGSDQALEQEKGYKLTKVNGGGWVEPETVKASCQSEQNRAKTQFELIFKKVLNFFLYSKSSK